MKIESRVTILVIIVLLSLSASLFAKAADPLPSWSDGETKSAIVAFITKVTDKTDPDFVPVAKRIATFDNDGTLWVEHPLYTQLAFALDRVKALAPKHPEWKEKQPFKAVLKNDMKALAKSGRKGLLEIIAVSHAGMSVEDFESIVTQWIETAKHPRFDRHYTELVYQPMLELLSYLRANGFKTFIVSGGGIEFMRPWTDKIYGIPSYQVVGSSIKTEYLWKDNEARIMRKPALNFIDDKADKPVGINEYIGMRPIFAVGNSDGDYEMLQWTTTRKDLPSFGAIVHHTDGKREYAYDRDTPFGTLSKGLDDAGKYHWHLIDMKKDWKTIFPSR